MATCKLPSMFKSIEEAKQFLKEETNFSQPATQTISSENEVSLAELLTTNPQDSSSPICLTPVRVFTEDTMRPFKKAFLDLCTEEQVQLIGELFQKVVESEGVTVPTDFIVLSLRAMKQLKCSGRSNFLYGLSQGLGEQRTDGSDSIFPSKRLISGLFEHCVNFFAGSSNVRVIIIILKYTCKYASAINICDSRNSFLSLTLNAKVPIVVYGV